MIFPHFYEDGHETGHGNGHEHGHGHFLAPSIHMMNTMQIHFSMQLFILTQNLMSLYVLLTLL